LGLILGVPLAEPHRELMGVSSRRASALPPVGLSGKTKENRKEETILSFRLTASSRLRRPVALLLNHTGEDRVWFGQNVRRTGGLQSCWNIENTNRRKEGSCRKLETQCASTTLAQNKGIDPGGVFAVTRTRTGIRRVRGDGPISGRTGREDKRGSEGTQKADLAEDLTL